MMINNNNEFLDMLATFWASCFLCKLHLNFGGLPTFTAFQ